MEFAAEQRSHGDSAQVFGPSGYVWRWGEATFENWQSEFLQLLTFVVLTSFLIHRGSHESKDSNEEMKASLDRMEQRLKRMESAATADRLNPSAGAAARAVSNGEFVVAAREG